MNWLLIGIGDVAVKRVLPAFADDPRSTLYGVVTSSRDKGLQYCSRVWADLAQAIADPAIDAVYVATPVCLHAPQTLLALANGKHVLCEKPMAMSYAEAQAMVNAATHAGRLLGAAYFRRMYPKLLRAADIIAAGNIGRPLLAEIQCHEWLDPATPRGWLLDPAKAGGGPLYDIGSHRIDVLNFLFGAPQSVSAHLAPVPSGVVCEQNATVTIDYAIGMRGVVDVRWDTRVPSDLFRITGETGVLDLTPLSGAKLAYQGTEEYWPCAENRHAPLISAFTSSIVNGVPFVASAANTLKAVMNLNHRRDFALAWCVPSMEGWVSRVELDIRAM